MFFIDSLFSGLFMGCEINSNMGFCTRLNNGVPEWSAWGADTWSPFKRKIGSSAATGSGTTFDCKFLSNYMYLNVNNFVLDVKSFSLSQASWGGNAIRQFGTFQIGKTYNAGTGTLTLTRPSVSGDVVISINVDVYVAY